VVAAGRLNSEERKLIEIAKTLYWKPDIFIVDVKWSRGFGGVCCVLCQMVSLTILQII